MKKVFVVTPFVDLTKSTLTAEDINIYIRRAVNYFKAKTDLLDEDFEVVTNFFLVPAGTDEDGTPIMKIFNYDNPIMYTSDVLRLVSDSDYVVLPHGEDSWYTRNLGFDTIDNYFSGTTILLPYDITPYLRPDGKVSNGGTILGHGDFTHQIWSKPWRV